MKRKIMKRKSIKTAMLIPSLCVLIAGIAIMVTVVGVISSKTAQNMTEQVMDARVDEHAQGFLVFSEDVYSTLKAAAPVIAHYSDTEAGVSDPRGEAIKRLSEILLSNEKVYALWTCWEPNAFDGKDSEYANTDFYDSTGRFVPYVYQDKGGFKLEALVEYEDPVKGEYYQHAIKSGKPYVTDPYAYQVDGFETYMCSFAIPIYKDGKAVGVVGADITLTAIMTLMNSGKILDEGYLYILSPGGFLATHPKKDFLMVHYNTGWMKNYAADIEPVLANGGSFNLKAFSELSNSSISFLGSSVTIGDTNRNWIICSVVQEKAVKASSDSLLVIIIAIGIVLVTLTGITISFIIHRYLKKLPPVADAAHKISEGNLDVLVGSSDNDEIADVSNALHNVKETIQKLIYDINKMSDEFKSGSISVAIDESAYKGEFQTVVKEINETFALSTNDTMVAIKATVEFGNGNFDTPIVQMNGDKAIMTTSLEAVQKNLKGFSEELSNIIDGATNGNLDVKMDVSQYKGDWNKMAVGVNGLIAAIVEPIREAINVLERLSGGNLDVTVNGNYKGEFGAMKSALNNTLDMLASYIKEISAILTALSQNDLAQSVEREYVGAFIEIKTALNIIIEKFNKLVSDIAAAAKQVADSAKQFADSSMILAQGASEQTFSVDELTYTVSIIDENALQNAESAKEAKELSDNSKINALNGNQEMNQMLISMNSIKDASNSISKIIKVIDDIAFQTNLLALNAAVEAARAGIHGKGFAVVAEEVRNLAGKSKEYAKETAVLIEESIIRVNEGTDISIQATDGLRTILNDVESVADIITNIAEVSDRQTLSISQVRENLSKITDVVQNNSATSEEAASASQKLAEQAEMLQGYVSVFKLKK